MRSAGNSAGDKLCRLRCPKCKSRDLTINEVMMVRGEFKVRDGRLVEPDGYFGRPEGHSLEVMCDRCMHEWRARNAATLDGAFND